MLNITRSCAIMYDVIVQKFNFFWNDYDIYFFCEVEKCIFNLF